MTDHATQVKDAMRALMSGADPHDLIADFGSECVEDAMRELENRI